MTHHNNHDNDNDNLHSERIRRLLDTKPPRAVRMATAAVIIFFAVIAAILWFTGLPGAHHH